MGVVRMERNIFQLNNSQKGQTVLEYIFLLIVVVFILTHFFSSSKFQQLFGEQGQVFEAYRTQMEYAYRNGLPSGPVGNAQIHPTYSPNMGQTRFFGAKGAYP